MTPTIPNVGSITRPCPLCDKTTRQEWEVKKDGVSVRCAKCNHSWLEASIPTVKGTK